jgi:hypothetical protein
MNEKKEKHTISDILLYQFQDKWRILKQAIEKIPEKKLHNGKGDWTYSWNIYHIIETADFYIRDTHEDMEWGKKARVDWDKDSKEKIKEKKSKITKEVILNYLEEIDKKVTDVLINLSDEDIMKKDGFYWFDSILGKLIYLLRHNHHHIGELAYALREWDCERIRWGR